MSIDDGDTYRVQCITFGYLPIAHLLMCRVTPTIVYVVLPVATFSLGYFPLRFLLRFFSLIQRRFSYTVLWLQNQSLDGF